MWVAVGIATVGAVSSIAGGISGKKAAEKAGEYQAKMIEVTAAENERRRRLELEQKMGLITANVGASNVLMSGSSKRYSDEFESQYRAEMSWDKTKARIEARMAEKTGQAAGSAAMYSGIGSAVGFAGQAFSAASSALSAKKPSGGLGADWASNDPFKSGGSYNS